ncbi:MAG: hypothetical protein WBW53_08170 [Terriglobales bacterium]
MELGAVVVVPAREDLTVIHEVQPHKLTVADNPRPLYSSRMPILGNDVLHSWMERVRKLGVQSLWLTSSLRDDREVCLAPPKFARQAVERLLMIMLKSYAEMDLADLLRFHCERRNPVTEAHDARGQLGVCLLDHRELHATGKKWDLPSFATNSGRTPYQFRGYAKRILSAQERQELVRDGLTGACAMRPSGTEIQKQVWIGEGVNLADSVRVIGPSYIGANTIVRAGATIGPFASVERDCVVDCGTTVEHSTVLPHTYLAPGLLIRHQLVDGRYLEDLDWGAVADLQPAGLGGRIHRRESSQHASVIADAFSRAESGFAWDFAPSSTTPQPWLQVQL